ncbi:N-acetylmuramoyl-L-alanine amidase AmiC [BD1-7 clade bacterium]|uniref:N-acetylmuramoyl-L-alanine amidase AmiC n=1 Tax=BD1-7 clade bacterium TaxID=2029982 RepID=A0A5S9MZA9_9GAMM|nr:N-acetylmuramoyl-L-alanine amidase AmiC [BD1-7 clade bacterium]CAA0082567.1 N-acetylmuramoyl-L-alanine amidase AmiC [BD1-7 clade bacterium]
MQTINTSDITFRYSGVRLVLLCFMALLALPVLAQTKVTDIRLWQAPTHTRFVFDLDRPVEHKLITLASPNRIVIDMPNAALATDTEAVAIKGSPVRLIRSATRNKTDLRVVFDLSRAVKARSFLLKKNGEKGDRLVIDLSYLNNPTGQAAAAMPTPTKSHTQTRHQKRDLIIAIDAGHGGEDPGALGPKKIREKKVVLNIAKELAYLFKVNKGYSPVLIRSSDFYVALVDRREKARKARADMFVSIHADAFTNPKAHGASVYALSSRGASSASARFLADKENQSDMVGGVSLSDKDALLSSVLVDLSMDHKMQESLDVGSYVLRHVGKLTKLHSKRVEQAAFSVLKTPDIPSILVETGFISNPKEAKALNTKSYQRKMARAIYNGIHDYFKVRAPEGTYIASKHRKNKKVIYVVEQGDTLSQIASRYAVSMSQIRSHNRLRNDQLRIGQQLKIPVRN